MKEVEQKFRVEDHSLLDSKFKFGEPIVIVDTYFQHPCKDFMEADEWLRVRRVSENNALISIEIIHKGAKSNNSRRELEVYLDLDQPLDSSPEELFTILGFKVLVVVRKTRREASIEIEGRRATIVLDEVDALGKYVEIEILVPNDEDVEASVVAIENCARALGLKDPVSRGYAQLMGADGWSESPPPFSLFPSPY